MSSRPLHHQPAAPGAGPSPNAENAEPASAFGFGFGLEFPDAFETTATDPSAAPPGAVNIARAITDGKRARRTRAVRVTSSAAAGVAVIGCVTALVSGGGAARPQTAGAAASTVPIIGTNPFVIGARYGWLPEGVAQDSASMYHGALWLAADSDDPLSHSSAPNIGLSLRTFPSGASEQSALAASATPATEGRRATASPQPPIGGRAAYAVTIAAPASLPTVPGFHNVTLLWQLSNGRWAELAEDVSNDSTATAATELLAQARHVAQTVTPDTAGAALPLSITGLPAGALITTYSLAQQNSSPTSWTTQIGVAVAGVTLVYDEGPVGDVLPLTLGPSKCTTHHTLEACVTLASGALSNRFPAGGLQALADDISLRSPAPATWTREVFPDY